MSRRWFWPLLVAAMLLFSLAGASALSIVMVYALYDEGEVSRRVTENSVIEYTYYVDIHPALYAAAALFAALGAALLIFAARLR